MSDTIRIEQALSDILGSVQTEDAPPRLSAALRYAVFPGGARIRPRLCLAVARACGDDRPPVTDSAAAAIELLHCASLVHDDLPCFDDAAMRRGKPSVHKAFGERLAVLGGDALIVLAFQGLAAGCAGAPERLRKAPAHRVAFRGASPPASPRAGRECEPFVDLSVYQRAKTSALFAAATEAGAAAAGVASEPWRLLGDRLGEAFQIADDILDVAGDAAKLGKPIGQDATHARPSGAAQLGLEGAIRRLGVLVDGAVASIPDCPGAEVLRAHVLQVAANLLPAEIAEQAA
ncbi:MAG: polyprenyl synthetase family protein [Betaproteobacteria bacterium]|nr:polyprenyl synthetase family protein [Betaproteobacteria bacterium]